MHNGFWHWITPAMGWFVIVLVFLFWLLVVLAIAYLARNISPMHGESPFDILKKRYARGEIGREEFERRKKDLEENDGEKQG